MNQSIQGNTAIVSSTFGKFRFDVTTGMVVGDASLEDRDDPILKVDIDEYRTTYPDRNMSPGDEFDILNFGYFLTSGRYETPAFDWREEKDFMLLRGHWPWE